MIEKETRVWDGIEIETRERDEIEIETRVRYRIKIKTRERDKIYLDFKTFNKQYHHPQQHRSALQASLLTTTLQDMQNFIARY